jgi:hypothetical protein
MKTLQRNILNIIKRANFNRIPSLKFFSGCGNDQCGCKGGTEKVESDDFEKKMKSINYKIIQCINLGKYDDALELSNDYIKQLKENYGI